MASISKKAYLKYAMEQGHVFTIAWISTLLGIPLEPTDYVKPTDSGYDVMVNNEWVSLEESGPKAEPLALEDILEVESGFMRGITKSTKAPLGRLLLWYIVVEHPFKGKIPYLTEDNSKMDDKSFVPADIENQYIAPMLGNEITIQEYETFVDACTYVRDFSEVIGISATEKSMLPPPNIAKERDKLIKDMIDRKGEDALKDYANIVEIETKLKEIDAEWLADDPSFDIVISGKVRNNARKKMFLMFGAEEGLKKPGEDAYLIKSSLSEGLPTDPKSVAELNNSARAGSYSRGVETFKGGLLGKIMLRALNTVTIEDGDCNTKLTSLYTITENNYDGLIGRYIVENGSLVYFDNRTMIEKYIGKTVELRSMRFCNSPGETFCKVCAGTNMTKTSVPLITTDIAGTILNASMKKMHNATMQTTKFDIFTLLS